MQLHSFAEASGYLGSVLGVAMVVPQIVRTFRDRTVPGVSALSWALTALSCATWMLYGVRSGEIPQIPGNVLLVTGAVVVVLAVPSGTTARRRATYLLLCGGVITTAAFTVPPTALGFGGFALGLVSALPQTAKSLSRHSAVSGVSLPSWALRVASQSCWLFYALIRHDLVVTISACFILTNAVLLIGIELARRSAPVPAPAAAAEPVLAGTP